MVSHRGNNLWSLIYHWNGRWAFWLVTTTSAPTPAPPSSRPSGSVGEWRWSRRTTRGTSGPAWTSSPLNYLAPSWSCSPLLTSASSGSWRTNLSSARWLTSTSVPASSREDQTQASRESSGCTPSTCKSCLHTKIDKIKKYYKLFCYSSKILDRLSYEKKYNRDDFTVEYLTTLVDNIPTVTNRRGRKVLDIGLLAPDCFHFMKELHSRAGV